ncbi:MAG: endonuclease/exonuclease/phosphatase family protein [Desulfobacterales bacterium]|jgi:endonuclease/exonuclease/phosphatase family metal-dependent hydrolase|nr:endonuclease/exonuclease/phosphatase family protein [Desulfobacterales bacterium]
MFSILTLNLRFGLAQDGPNGWEFRKKSLKKLLDRYPTDFAGFQEVNDFQFDFIADALGKNVSSIGRRISAPDAWQNNVIFYRNPWQCVHRDHFYLSSTPDIPSRFQRSKWPRQCTVGMFQKGSERVICVNTHFDFDAEVQADSARVILDRMLSLPVNVPVVLFGDFNAVPGSPCYRVLTEKHADRPANARVFKEVFCRPYPATHHGFTGKTDGAHIDWVLFEGALSPISCTVLQQKFDGRYPSDHYPLVTFFEGS